MTEKYLKAHELLRAYPYDSHDWELQSDDLIEDIRRSDDNKSVAKRIRRAFYWLFIGGSKGTRSEFGDGVGHRVNMFLYALQRSSNSPDAYLGDGAIITEWAEDGKYIELVQPSVGELIADFLEAEPENEHAKKIAAEIERIGNK